MKCKKLKLHNETIRRLDADELELPQGGLAKFTAACPSKVCPPSVYPLYTCYGCDYC